MKRETGHQRRKRHDEERAKGVRLPIKESQAARKERKAKR
jgi:hypothetical protein